MKMGGTNRHTNRGFTIVEVMIVLAVTSVLFVSATVYISGRQAKTDFQVGSQQIQQQIQQVISDVQNGYYPSGSKLSCSVTNGSITLGTAGTTQGTNLGCIFVGKVLLFGGSNPTQYKVFSLAGKQFSSGTTNVTNAAEATPVAIAPTSASSNIPDLTTNTTLPNGLTFQWGQSNDNGGYNSGYTASAIISDFSPISTGATMQTGGAQNFSLHGFSGQDWATLAQDATTSQQATLINKESTLNDRYPSLDKMRYCFASGGTDQSVLITVTSGLQVSSEIKWGTTCGVTK